LSDQTSRPCLVLLEGPGDVGSIHRLRFGETVVGRGQGSELRLADESVSRRHARVVVDRGSVWIEDLNSANGTFVNGAAVTHATKLAEGDRIRLGTALLKFTRVVAAEEMLQQQMHGAAMRDALTGTFNRAYLMQRVDSELAYARRHKTSLGLLMLDVDHFKTVNDTHGHLAGDQVLVQLSRTVEWTIRTEDVLARYGGEEFCVVCRGVPFAGARNLAERIRTAVTLQRFACGAVTFPVTVTIGVAALPEIGAATREEFFAAADAALLRGKREGRNRVVTATPTERALEAEPLTVRSSMLPLSPPEETDGEGDGDD